MNANTEGDTQRWLTTSETARLLRVSTSRVRYLISEGRLGAHKDSGQWLIPQEEALRRRNEQRQRKAHQAQTSSRRHLDASVEPAQLLERVESLEREAGRLEAQLALESVTKTTVEEQLEREKQLHNETRERADRLEEELREARQPWWRKLFST